MRLNVAGRPNADSFLDAVDACPNVSAWILAAVSSTSVLCVFFVPSASAFVASLDAAPDVFFDAARSNIKCSAARDSLNVVRNKFSQTTLGVPPVATRRALFFRRADFFERRVRRALRHLLHFTQTKFLSGVDAQVSRQRRSRERSSCANAISKRFQRPIFFATTFFLR